MRKSVTRKRKGKRLRSDVEVVDLVGKAITAGCSVVYPVRRGSSMWLKRMQVQQVTKGKNPELTGYNSEGRRVTIRNLSNCAVIEERVAV